MAEKTHALAQLRHRIINELYVEHWREVWFFPPLGPVRGWQGTRDVVFVGLNPSMGTFPDAAVQLLYDQLAENGFADAHLTDVIKERALGRDVERILSDAPLMDLYRHYLVEELNILRARLLVPMGAKATKAVRRWSDSLPSGLDIQPIPHYSPRFPNENKRREFTQSMAAIRASYFASGARAQ